MTRTTKGAAALALAAACALAPGLAAQAPGPILQEQGRRWLPSVGRR